MLSNFDIFAAEGLSWTTRLFLMKHVPAMAFVFCFGAAVGSFINVVNYRLPLGMSVTVPPSRCSTCGARLRFFRENLPILGWFLVRGRCRYCGVRVSAEYMLLELIMACIFLLLYTLLFIVEPWTPWWGEIGGRWWYANEFFRAWPVYVAWTFLIAGLISMTIIDARTYTIPIQIPLFITFTAFIMYPLQSLLPHRATGEQSWPIPAVGWSGLLIATGGMAGIALSVILLRLGKLRYSFADYDQYLKPDEVLADYPHARREMLVELLFLVPCLLGLVAGSVLASRLSAAEPPAEILQAIGGSFMGYLVGGGLIWSVRILGTLGFGREAMGMGDVHLLAAVGAVLGWFDPILVMPFMAPFIGLLWWIIVSIVVRKASLRERWQAIPFGPHLAIATLVLIFLRPGIHRAWDGLFGPEARPSAGLVLPE